jgi:hypothetical protein
MAKESVERLARRRATEKLRELQIYHENILGLPTSFLRECVEAWEFLQTQGTNLKVEVLVMRCRHELRARDDERKERIKALRLDDRGVSKGMRDYLAKQKVPVE